MAKLNFQHYYSQILIIDVEYSRTALYIWGICEKKKIWILWWTKF